MISCTDFIAAYSELFSFVEERHGRQEVSRLWLYLFRPTGGGIPLIDFIKREGLRGCFSYWAGTLSEEAADFTMYLSEKRGYFRLVMHRCPSKGRLLTLGETKGITPYRDYCLHCDSYRSAAEEAGLGYIYDFTDMDSASCSILIFDPKVFDGRIIVDPDTEVMERRASDNAYYHPDFHSSMNMGIQYLGEKYGTDEVRAYLIRYANNIYKNDINDIRRGGLAAIKGIVEESYRKERASDAVSTELRNDALRIFIDYCPAVRHLRSTGRSVSPWFRYTTETVLEELAGMAGYRFAAEAYDEETGQAQYAIFA